MNMTIESSFLEDTCATMTCQNVLPMYLSGIQLSVEERDDVCICVLYQERLGATFVVIRVIAAMPEVFFGIFLEGSLIDSRRVADWSLRL